MEAVNKVVDAGYKAIWGEQNTNTTNTQTTASGSQPTTSTGMTGIQSIDKVVEAGKRAIWEQYGAPPVEADGLPTSIPVSEQRNIETADTSLNTANMGRSSGTATAQDLKTTAIGLRHDPAQPGNAGDSTARAIHDGGPGQTLKHTSEPFEEGTQKLAKDLQNIKVDDDKLKVHTLASGVAVSRPNQAVHRKEASLSSSSSGSSAGAVDNQGQGQKSKTSKLEKVKNKLHIGNHSPKPSQ